MFQNRSNEPNGNDGPHDIEGEGMGWKPWATVNFNLCDPEAAAELVLEGKRLFGADNVLVVTMTEKRWKILVRPEDPDYMDR